MVFTLLTSHEPMSWLKADAPLNIELYDDTQHTEKEREAHGRKEEGIKDTPSGHDTR
jgi:hypothetical protein